MISIVIEELIWSKSLFSLINLFKWTLVITVMFSEQMWLVGLMHAVGGVKKNYALHIQSSILNFSFTFFGECYLLSSFA